MKFQIKIYTKYGEFKGEIIDAPEEEYKKLLLYSKDYYKDGGFEMVTDDGDFIIVSPEIVKCSILKIIKVA